jgi:hypothetical protein
MSQPPCQRLCLTVLKVTSPSEWCLADRDCCTRQTLSPVHIHSSTPPPLSLHPFLLPLFLTTSTGPKKVQLVTSEVGHGVFISGVMTKVNGQLALVMDIGNYLYHHPHPHPCPISYLIRLFILVALIYHHTALFCLSSSLFSLLPI